jgi:hypothetical protein
MFYRLYNRYKGGLYMEGLQFNLIPSVETIAGSGVFEAEAYSAAELDKVLDKLQQNPLMLDLDSEAELRLRKTVLKELYNLITKEYGNQEEKADKLGHAAKAGQKMPLTSAAQPRLSVNVLPIESLDAAVTLRTVYNMSAKPHPKEDVEQIQENLDYLLRTAVANLKTTLQIEPVNLMVGSGGLYLDASVGALPSTEPYSEEMRKREIRMRDAEIFATRSKGVLREARAKRIVAGDCAEEAAKKAAKKAASEDPS